MNLKISKSMSVIASLLMLTTSMVALSGTAANAAETPYTQNFDNMETYSGIDFDGNSTTLVTDQPAGEGFTSGKAIKLDNQGAPWAGTKFVLPETSSFISTANATGTISIYSPDAEDRCFLAKLEAGAIGIERIVRVNKAGWQTISVDYSANYDATKNYNVLALMPNLAGIGCATWGGEKALTTWYVDNISYPGARDAAETTVVVVPRTAPSLLVNFESNDTSGYALTSFGGNSSAVVNDAPAGGSVGSVSALKVTTAAPGWSGTTFIKKGVKESLISTGKMAVTANIYSPVAGKVIMMKIECLEHPSQVVEVRNTSVLGWKTYTFDFTVGGNVSALDYPVASIFFDFDGAKTDNPWYIDDIAFNGATPAALAAPETPVTPVLVNFESSDSSGYTLTDFGGNTATKVTDAPAGGSAGSTTALKIVSAVDCWGGTSFLTSGSSLIATGASVVKANIYSPAAGQMIKLKLENSVNDTLNREVNVTSVSGWSTYTFTFANFDSAVSYNKASLFTNFTCDLPGSKNTDAFYVDDIAFLGATGAALGGVVEPPVVFTGNANVRLVGMDDTNSFNRPADAAFWSVENNWYRVGVNARTKQVPVGSTQALTYLVTNAADNTPLANTTVTFVFGKQYSSSNAKVNVGAIASTGEERTVTGVTNSEGRVTFTLVNTDVAADAANNPGANLGADFSGKKLFTQATAWVTSQAQDSIDMVDFVFFKPADAPVTKTAVSRLTGVNSTNAWISEGEGWYQYYAAGVRYIQRGVEVGTTTSLSFTVNDTDGAPYANKTVKLLLGKTYSGSSAKVAVNGTAFPGLGDEKVIELTTDASGVVSFDVSNSNFTADADPYQAANLKNPEGGKKLFVQIAVVGEKGNQDVLDIVDLLYYQAQAAAPATVYNARLADWDASNSFDGTKVWGDAGLGVWFDVHTGYFAHYVKAGSTFNLRYRVTNATTGANAPDGTVVTVALGAAWSSSNAKFTSGSTVIDGTTKWGANGQLDMGSVTATVVNGIATIPLTSNDVAEDATINPGSATANPDTLSPLFMQAKIKVEGNAVTRQDWVNIVVTQASDAPTVTAVSSTTGRRGQAIDIVGTNLGDALGQSVILYTAATSRVAAISTPVSVISVNAAGTRMTVRSPSASQKGTFRVTNTGGTAAAPASFTASSSVTSKPTITMTASVVKEVGSEITLAGTNLASSTSITIGSVSAPFRIVTATTVVLTVPAGVVSGSKISATNAGGVTTTSKYVYQAAVVATTTAAAKVGQTVTITGSNLKATSVVFGGNKSAKPVINDGDTLTVVVPTGALTGLIKITTGAGVVYTKSFTVTPPAPTVSSFTPTTGKKGVTAVTVRGTYLTGATVTIGSTPVTLSAGASSTSFKFVIPAGATSGKITVTTGGGSVSSSSTLTIN
jgi:hypothetical protein